MKLLKEAVLMEDELKRLIQARDTAIQMHDFAEGDYIDSAIYELKACDIRIEEFLRSARNIVGVKTDEELLERAKILKSNLFTA